MVRNTKKKALYEIIREVGSKTGFEQLHPKPEVEKPASQQGGDVVSPANTRWLRKPSVVQFNAGRVEFSIPYHVAIAAFLGVILVIIVTFRLGEWFATPPDSQMETTAKKQERPDSKVNEAVNQASDGKNRIVIQTYQVRTHLEPAKEYFDKLGVETEIIEKNNWYYLVTKNGYNNPDKQGTDGYLARQKIIELGAGYKAPVGFETFGPKPFKDAFGMKFEE